MRISVAHLLPLGGALLLATLSAPSAFAEQGEQSIAVHAHGRDTPDREVLRLSISASWNAQRLASGPADRLAVAVGTGGETVRFVRTEVQRADDEDADGSFTIALRGEDRAAALDAESLVVTASQSYDTRDENGQFNGAFVDSLTLVKRGRAWVAASQLADYSDYCGQIRPHAVLAYCDLRYAALSRMNLTGVNLTGAGLQGANVTMSVLERAVMTAASLRSADLRDASLLGAYIPGADFSDVRLEGATWVDGTLCDWRSIGECRVSKTWTGWD